MIFAMDMIVALVLGLVLSYLLVGAFSRRGPGPFSGGVYFFLLLFLAIWAAGAWAQPVGPLFYDASLVSFAAVGLILLLIVLALIPPAAPPAVAADETREEAEEEAAALEAGAIGFGIVFWLLMFLFVGSLVARYALGEAVA